ncbi:hypothetical protein V2H45_08740 [Tumidithrix elongata RA019]|uniref:Uncharacterized protein n=1 Tax=Tumidithrix elongata BACA0141 TaxID=2716417 RepID=A0AAW9PVR4_9CYAN|nr:hypothetical protein [Tumidithrix elongata RA019]
MERGLLWLPLLSIFIWLAWSGWNEYQKIEAYKLWATQFERHKFDIYAVLGQKGDRLTWGKPTRKEPIALKSVNLPDLQQVRLKLDRKLIEVPIQNLPEGSQVELPTKAKDIEIELVARSGEISQIPFTDIAIAYDWYRFLASRVN